jgi:hypothetical protein
VEEKLRREREKMRRRRRKRTAACTVLKLASNPPLFFNPSPAQCHRN